MYKVKVGPCLYTREAYTIELTVAIGMYERDFNKAGVNCHAMSRKGSVLHVYGNSFTHKFGKTCALKSCSYYIRMSIFDTVVYQNMFYNITFCRYR